MDLSTVESRIAATGFGLPADTVVCALGMRANRKETDSLREAAKTRDLPVYEIGGCVRAVKVYEAVHEGYLAGMTIL